MRSGSVVEVAGRARPWRARLSTDGKRVELGYYSTQAEAERVVRAAQAEAPDEGETLASYGARWLDRRERAGVAGIRQERSAWAAHVLTAPFAYWPLRRIRRTDLVAWLRDLVVTESQRTSTTGIGDDRRTARRGTGRLLARQTIANALGLVRRCLSDAADDGLVPVPVAVGVRVPRVRVDADERDATWTYLSADEIASLEALPCEEHAWALRGAGAISWAQRSSMLVAIYTGLRAGELWGLRWCDVDLESAQPTVHVQRSRRAAPKSRTSRRRIPLLAPAAAALREWRARRPGVGVALVWPSESGGCHAPGYDAGWAHVRRMAGITRRVRWHDLRHTCASHLLIGTWGRAWRLEEVRDYLGHSSVVVTQRYAHLGPQVLDAAALATPGPNLVPRPGTAQASSAKKS